GGGMRSGGVGGIGDVGGSGEKNKVGAGPATFTLAPLAGSRRGLSSRFLCACRRIGSARADRGGRATSPDQFDGDYARRRGSRNRRYLGVRLVVPLIQRPGHPQPGRVL